MSRPATPANPARRQKLIDAAATIALVGALCLAAPDDSVLFAGDATTLYGTVTGAGSAIAALALTPIAIVLGLSSGERLRALLRQHNGELRTTSTRAVAANLFAAALGVIGLVIDNSTTTLWWLRLLAVTVLLFGFLAVLRLARAFASVLEVHAKDTHEPLDLIGH
jgi:hypothetical protein